MPFDLALPREAREARQLSILNRSPGSAGWLEKPNSWRKILISDFIFPQSLSFSLPSLLSLFFLSSYSLSAFRVHAFVFSRLPFSCFPHFLLSCFLPTFSFIQFLFPSSIHSSNSHSFFPSWRKVMNLSRWRFSHGIRSC